MRSLSTRAPLHYWILVAAFIFTTLVYWPGLHGGFLFDDYPNIVDNHGVQPSDASLPRLVLAALSSPASDFKRPLASLSFAANYLVTGLDPYWMKLTNLVIHLLNGLLVFLLARRLLESTSVRAAQATQTDATSIAAEAAPTSRESLAGIAEQQRYTSIIAALIAAGWMLLPINLTSVLYVVQRMESMANLFVMLGLIGYVTGRQRMLAKTLAMPVAKDKSGWKWFWLCALSITVPAAFGVLAKETAAMLPLYALLIEWALFGFDVARPQDFMVEDLSAPTLRRKDWRLLALFLFVLVLPMVIGLAWLLPSVLNPSTWAARDFTLGTRLLSESRIVIDYIDWTMLPTPSALSFYHDDFHISTGLLTPWTTLASIVALVALFTLMLWLRPHRPLAALGIALFLGCQLLTGTILPLELIYEHRNYFASFGLLLAVVPILAAPSCLSRSRGHALAVGVSPVATRNSQTGTSITPETAPAGMLRGTLPLALPRHTLLAGLMLCWAVLTALTAYAWSNPLRLAADLAVRAPQSPRAQYELGRTYIIYSHYDPSSPFAGLAYAPLERSAALPDSSILPEQALIFMNARMRLPLKDAWWDSMIAKLKAHKSGVQDESSLAALTQCDRDRDCELPANRMTEAYLAALSHPGPSARLLAMYGDYAWNILDDHALGERMTEEAVKASPNEPAYQITMIRMLAVQGRKAEANKALKQLERLNVGGSLGTSLTELRALPGLQ